MSMADPDAVLRYYECIDAEEYESVFGLFADDVTYERPGRSKLAGMDEFRTFYLERRSLDEGHHEIHEVVVDDDTVAVRGSFTGRQGDEEVAFDFADFHRFDSDGKITERWTYTDRDEV